MASVVTAVPSFVESRPYDHGKSARDDGAFDNKRALHFEGSMLDQAIKSKLTNETDSHAERALESLDYSDFHSEKQSMEPNAAKPEFDTQAAALSVATRNLLPGFGMKDGLLHPTALWFEVAAEPSLTGAFETISKLEMSFPTKASLTAARFVDLSTSWIISVHNFPVPFPDDPLKIDVITT